MLNLFCGEYYRVKKGDSAAGISAAFGVPLSLLCHINELKEEVAEGEIILMPKKFYPLKIVGDGDSKESLCSSAEKFRELNGTHLIYIGMSVFTLPSQK